MASDIDAILRLEVPLIVRLGERRMKLQEVLQLAPGSILELPKNAEDSLDLLVNNRAIGGGDAVKVGEYFGIKIEWIGGAEDRIKALGPDQPENDDDAIAMRLLSGSL